MATLVTGGYVESDPLGLEAGINTYSYGHGDPLGRVDPLGLDDTVCMYDPAMCGYVTESFPAYGQIRPEAKAYLCSLLRQTNGQFQLAWKLAIAQKRSDGLRIWANPVWQETENWLYSAGWPPGWYAGYGFSINWQNTDPAIALQQLLKYPLRSGHSRPSMPAYLAAMEARKHRLQDPKDVLKWCDGCNN